MPRSLQRKASRPPGSLAPLPPQRQTFEQPDFIGNGGGPPASRRHFRCCQLLHLLHFTCYLLPFVNRGPWISHPAFVSQLCHQTGLVTSGRLFVLPDLCFLTCKRGNNPSEQSKLSPGVRSVSLVHLVIPAEFSRSSCQGRVDVQGVY